MNTEEGPETVVDRLVKAVNDHDLEALVACFDEDYVNETPVHPQRGFRGNAQVRKNWTQILAAVPELQARVLNRAVDQNRVWTEWDMAGIRHDGSPFLMAGVVIFGVTEGRIASARFYLDPVDRDSGDVNASVSRAVGNPIHSGSTS